RSCPVETSKRWRLRDSCITMSTCCCWMSPRAASTWPARPRFTRSSTTSSARLKQKLFFSSAATFPSCSACAIASPSCRAVGLRVVPFIVTLGTMLLVRGAAKGLSDERRIEAPITWLNDLLRTVRDDNGSFLPLGIWITMALALVVAGTLQYTRFGRHLFAVGSNERTARLCGVRVDQVKVAVYTVAAMLAALAGVMEFSRLSVGDPTVAVGLEL